MYFIPLIWLSFDCSRCYKATFGMQKKKVVPDWFEFGSQQKERALVPIGAESLSGTTSRDTHSEAVWTAYHVFSASRMLLHGLSSNQKSTYWRLKQLTGITRDHPSFKSQNWEIIRFCKSFWVLHSAHCGTIVLIRRYKATSLAQLVICLLLNE